MLKALEAFRNGAAPPGVDQPDLYQAWSGFLTAPNREDWESIYTENLGRVACPT
jgi:hypothetical protein